MYQKPMSKEQRKQWWLSLTSEQRAAYITKKELARSTNGSEKANLDIPPLTDAQWLHIHNTMRSLGLERFIVT